MRKRLPRQYAGIVEQVLVREIVQAVNYKIKVFHQAQGVVNG